MIVCFSYFPCSVFQHYFLDVILRVSLLHKALLPQPTVECGGILLNVTCELSPRLAVHLQNQNFAQNEHILTNMYF